MDLSRNAFFENVSRPATRRGGGAEGIELFTKDQAFLRICDLAYPRSLRPLSRQQVG
jgi:hypothetical protein